MNESERLKIALAYAVQIIEAYQLDIRNSAWTGVDLLALGFCQGPIYRGALRDIERRATGETKDTK